MANSGITWGKPLVEFGLTGAEDAAPSSFKTMPTAEENTVLLTTVKEVRKNCTEKGMNW